MTPDIPAVSAARPAGTGHVRHDPVARPQPRSAVGSVAFQAVVVGIETGGLTIIDVGGRLLGIEGLPKATVGGRLSVAFPAGLPGLGTLVAALVSEPEASAAPMQASARLVARPQLPITVELQRVADGRTISTIVVPDAQAASTPTAASANDAYAQIVDAHVEDAGNGRLRLATAAGVFLAPTGISGLLAGRMVRLLVVDPVQPTLARADAAGGEMLADQVPIALAAMVARSGRLHHAVVAKAASGRLGESALPSSPSGEHVAPTHLELHWLSEQLITDHEVVDVLLDRPAADEGSGGQGMHRRMILALTLSQLGDVQLDLAFAGQHIDLVLRTADPLDAQTLGELHGVIAATRDAGCGRIDAVVRNGLLPMPARPAPASLARVVA